MTSPTGNWVCDFLTPYVGLRMAELLSQTKRSARFEVTLRDSAGNSISDGTVTLSVKRYASQAPVFVTSETITFYPKYLLTYRWTWWPSDDDNFTFVLKALNPEKQVIAVRTHMVDSRSVRHHQKIDLFMTTS